MNRSALALTLCAISIFSGCEADKVARLEKQNQELQAQIQKQQASTDLDLQARCGRYARTFFIEGWRRDSDTVLLNYTNHFNKERSKCFIVVEYHFKIAKDSSWGNDMTLWDVYENAKYGHFYESHWVYAINNYKPIDEIITCEGPKTKCTGVDGFNDFLRPYMNN